MTNHEKFILLGWTLLEHKCHYYIFSNPTISDYEYDLLEKEYESLADFLGLEPSASNMVDFDMKRPSCKKVYEKIISEQHRVIRNNRTRINKELK